MKRFLLILIISLGYKISFGQVVPPEGITYQAVIIDRSIKELPGKDITESYYSNVDMVVKFTILSSQTGPTEYEETQSVKTDAYGLLNLVIGQGTPIGKTFNTIDWSKNAKWLKVEIDFNMKGTFELFSLEEMWSVPYALYSQRTAVADSIRGGIGSFKEKDGDTLNEIQTLKLKGDSIFISKANSIEITHPFNKDNDSTNEIQQLSISKGNDTIFLSKGGGFVEITNKTYTIGLHPELGGYVFYITPNGEHGLVAETQDQSTGSNFFDAPNIISMSANHSSNGRNFTDWRMPTINELTLMYNSSGSIGGFNPTGNYLSGTWVNNTDAWYLFFGSGSANAITMSISSGLSIRSVRSF
jgi:hypothetical protein